MVLVLLGHGADIHAANRVSSIYPVCDGFAIHVHKTVCKYKPCLPHTHSVVRLPSTGPVVQVRLQ